MSWSTRNNMIKFQDGKHDGKELQESFGQEIVSTSKRSQEHTIRISPKGQLISKCIFGVFNFFQKTNENKST